MKIIEDFPNYAITEKGDVWNIVTNKQLLDRFNPTGYRAVMLYNNNLKIKKRLYIHRLVAQAYIPNPDNKPTVDHINRHRYNCRVSNLRWASLAEQSANKGRGNNNTSGHTGITYSIRDKMWKFYRHEKGTIICRYPSKNKIDCIVTKFAWIVLKINRPDFVSHIVHTRKINNPLRYISRSPPSVWRFDRTIKGKKWHYGSTNSTDVIAYKYIWILRSKVEKRKISLIRELNPDLPLDRRE